MSVMKGITKDCLPLPHERSVQKKNLHHSSGHTFPFPQYWPGVSYIYERLTAFKFSCKISHIQDTLQKISHIYLRSYHFTLQHYFFICTRSKYPLKIFKEGKFWESDLKTIENFFEIIFRFYTKQHGWCPVQCYSVNG